MIAPLYFSCITIATVGYGDLHPDTSSWPLQIIVMTEIFAGLFVLAVLVGVVIGWTNEPPRGPGSVLRFKTCLTLVTLHLGRHRNRELQMRKTRHELRDVIHARWILSFHLVQKAPVTSAETPVG
jgi:ion channel